VTKTNALETLVIASFVRGLSVRDVEAALAEALGDQAAISKSAVSAICGQLRDEYQAWARRRLDEVMLDYLFLDASFFRMHPGSPAEPVLAGWGITTDGKPSFIGLAPASRGWRGLTMTSDGLRLLQDLRRSLLDPPRQLRPPTATTRDDDRPENVNATA
jgi:transposase-like protein